MSNPIIVALDVPTAEGAVRLARQVQPYVGGFKLGLELLMGPGPAVIGVFEQLGLPVFADAKLHDIPTTVERAAAALGAMGARWITAHAGGGRVMLEAANRGLQEGAAGRPAGVLAVTVLTRLAGAELADTGVQGTVGRQVGRLARLAAAAGCEGVVCSPGELGTVAEVAGGLLRVTPGIRPAGSDPVDQQRVATAAEALGHGADLLVVGRPITRASRPDQAAARMLEEISHLLPAGGDPVGRVAE